MSTVRDKKRKVNIIEAWADLPHSVHSQQYHKKLLAAYVRVSTSDEEQLSSYDAQVDYYTRHIKSNPEWEFVEVYADEGISGTNTKKRDNFNRMIDDALAGKIDLILTKSVSRFARNTVDTLATVRKLKEKGVEVYFEKENIYTMDSKGELLITIMSSLAQEESRSISENVTWGIRKKMADGKISLAFKHFLGYEKGEDGLPQIVEEEAKIVRKIYSLFLEGLTYRSITEYLMAQNIPSPTGKTKWNVSTVISILGNEKYKGDALLQKTYTLDFLNKTVRKNEGELPQYYIENSHPAIIKPETFDLVQNEMKKRQPIRRQRNNCSPFTAKIICGDCGGYYGSKVWHSNSKYRYVGWRCNRKYTNEERCNTPSLREEELKAAFVRAINQILGDKNRYINQFKELLPLLADTSLLENQLEAAQEAFDIIFGKMHRLVEENARQVQNQEEYNRQFDEMSVKCKEANQRVEQIKDEIIEQSARKEKLHRFLDELMAADDIVADFDENLCQSTVESVTVSTNKTLLFTFRDGTEILVTVSEAQ